MTSRTKLYVSATQWYTDQALKTHAKT